MSFSDLIRTCINMKAQLDGRLESGFLRFYGVAELHEDGPMRDAIFARDVRGKSLRKEQS